MSAIEMDLTEIVDLFYQYLPRPQYIDEIMLVACKFAVNPGFLLTNVDPMAFRYFEQALQMHEPQSQAIPVRAYQFRRECQTRADLSAIRFNAEFMFIQGLIVYERLLVERDEISLLIPELVKLSNHYHSMREYYKSLFVLLHAYSFIQSCQDHRTRDWYSEYVTAIGTWFETLLSTQEALEHVDKIVQALVYAFNAITLSSYQAGFLCLYAAYVS